MKSEGIERETVSKYLEEKKSEGIERETVSKYPKGRRVWNEFMHTDVAELLSKSSERKLFTVGSRKFCFRLLPCALYCRWCIAVLPFAAALQLQDVLVVYIMKLLLSIL